MAGAACKVIIDNGREALSSALFTVVTHPLVRGVMVPVETCDCLIQALADIDLHSYRGAKPNATAAKTGIHTLTDVLLALQAAGAVTDEVWEIFRHPGNPAVPATT